MNRREFFRSLGRYTAVGVTTAIGAIIYSKSKSGCVNSGLCKGCDKIKECGLPQALISKGKNK